MFEQFSHYWQQTLNWQPTPEQELRFTRLYELVLEGNKTQNLTRITEPADFWEKHLWDSLRGVLPLWDRRNLRAIDIGTGAGFPGLPVAIAHPTWHITLLDSKHKKTAFIAKAIAEIPLKNATSLTGRAEDLNRTELHYQQYDLAFVRAVGNAELCAAYTLPFLKPNGQAVLYRGQLTVLEEAHLNQTCQNMKAKVKCMESFATPLSSSIRHCIYLAKSG